MSSAISLSLALAGQAYAQDETTLFAMHFDTTIKQTIMDEIVYEAFINQQSKETLVLLQLVNGNLLIAEKDVTRWKLPIPDNNQSVAYKGERFYATSDLPAAKYAFDDNHLTMEVVLPASSFGSTTIDRQEEPIAPHRSLPGGFFNYDFFAQKTEQKSIVDGNLELGFFNAHGVGIWSMLARDIGRSSEITRLDSSWTIDQPEHISSWRIGDAISRGGSIGQSVRFGGLQYSTNFATRPDLVTFPQLSLNGSAVLPSTVDVYLNNIKSFSQDVPPGSFSLNQLPVFTGSGEARLVVRDLFGREQVITQPYYASRSLLTKDLQDYSYEAGLQRQDYGVASDHYQDFFASATHRYGLTNDLTTDAHAELQADRQLLSLGAVYLAKNIGVVNATLATSHQKSSSDGYLISVGYERQGSEFSFGARSQLSDKNFSQLGQTDEDRSISRLNTVFMGWHQIRFGSLSVNYINQLNRNNFVNSSNNQRGFESKLINISYSRNIFGNWFLNANAIKDLKNQQGSTILFGITKSFDQYTSANLSATHSQNSDQNLLQVQRSLPVGAGFGYRLLAGQGDNSRAEIGLSTQNDVGTYTIEAANTGSQEAYRASVSGGVVYLPNKSTLAQLKLGQLIFSRKINDSFAVVDVGGYADVSVYAENQLIGKTNASGLRIVPNLRSYQHNNITIEPKDLQLDAEISGTKMQAVPYFRSMDYLKFPVRKVQAATLRLLQKNGQVVPSGVIFTINKNDADAFPIAQNGLLYLSRLENKNHIIGQWADQQCEFDLIYPQNVEPMPNLGEYRCD